ncbi:MAG: FAD-binding oxidoreductase, partial [Chloroflexi bacterium]|nr:FAD-binding oxidoreductase [Chloroflexota bacterium]
DFAAQTGVRLIPYGGGSSVVGHINPLPGDAPVLTVDLGRMNRLLELDEASRLATFECGVPGPALEQELNQRGYTLGHFPQSFEFSTLGGWIATRSTGQQSYHYGRIEPLFAGGRLLTPLGTLDLPAFPASAAGPDLRHLVLGSEGRLGILTQAQVRIRPLPQKERFLAIFFPDWDSGMAAVKHMAQSGLAVSMLRLSDPVETETTLVLSGHDRLVSFAKWGLSLIGQREQRCMLIFGLTGRRDSTALAYRQVQSMARPYGGFAVNFFIGDKWQKSRFYTPYLRNTLWEHGYALDTLETALPWKAVPEAVQAIQASLHAALQPWNERVLVFSHLSHLYTDGASMYVTYLFRRAADPLETEQRWRAMKQGASEQIVRFGGTISHQHGIGLDHAAYLAAEKGPLGMEAIRSALHHFDPQGILNPGKLVDTSPVTQGDPLQA